MRVPFLIMTKYFNVFSIFMKFCLCVLFGLFSKKFGKCLNALENVPKMFLGRKKYKFRFAEDFDNSLSWNGFCHIFSAYFFHENLSEIILYQLTVNIFWYPTFLNSQETKPSVFLNLFLNKWCYNNIIYI